MNEKEAGNRRKRLNRAVIALLAFILLFSLAAADIPAAKAAGIPAAHAAGLPAAYAYSEEETGDAVPAEPPQQTDEPQPSESPVQTDEPQLTEAPAQTDEPQPSETDELKTTEVNGRECVDGEVLVKFKDTVTDAGITNVIEAADSGVQEELTADNLVVTDVPEGETVESFIEEMEGKPGVEYAQPNYILRAEKTVNDPFAGPADQWYLGMIGAYDAWDVTMGSSSIKVAVIDTGIDLDHPDLLGKVYAQYDYVNNDSVAQDDNGHGTHVAGIIAANADNGEGVAGVAPGVRLIAVKALGAGGLGTTGNCVKSINYAVSHGADIINMSFGGLFQSTAITDAVNNAVKSGVVCVAAAGNDETSGYFCPGDIESCISVTSTDAYDGFADFSNYGPAKDIAAPGVNIYSTYDPAAYPAGNYYLYNWGTSMSSPIVAGVAALMLSVNPGLTVSQVKDVLYSTAVDRGEAGKDDFYGYGRVDARNAVNKVKAGTPVITSAISTGYNSIELTWDAVDGAAAYEVWRSVSSASGYKLIASNVTETTYSNSGLTPGTTYYYKVKVNFGSGGDIVPGYFSAYYSVRPVPPAPAACSAAKYDYDSIRVSWAPVIGASGYLVYRSTREDGTYTRIAATTRTYYTNNYVYTGTPYYYKVRAYRSYTSIYGGCSPVASAVAELNPMENVRAAVYYPTAIKVSWNAVPGRSVYRVYRSDAADGPYKYIGSTKYTYYRDGGLAVGRTYYYKVRAYRAVNGEKIFNLYSAAASDTTRVFRTENVNALMYSVTSNRITWNPVPGASGYEVSRCDAEGNVTEALSPDTRYTYYYDKTIIAGDTYFYKVRAFRNVYTDAGTEKVFGEYSVLVTCASKVNRAKAYSYSYRTVKITWSGVSGRDYYEIWKYDPAAEEYVYLNKTGYTYYYDSYLTTDTTYSYMVRARDTAGGATVYSGFSDAVSAAPKLKAVTWVRAYRYSSTKVKITWHAAYGATGYEIQRRTAGKDYVTIKRTTSRYYYNSGLTRGTKYYYRVRAYRTVGENTYYGPWSATVSKTP